MFIRGDFNMSVNTHLSRGIDYLGNLGAKLKDLQGYETLAHELIQNADDAKNVSSMTFDIREDAIHVDNDGIFTDCKEVEESECPWKNNPSIGHRCDFHRFRFVASGDKRDQIGTTGAFGIGFFTVYQVTDNPELISSGRHWKIHEDLPEDKRIEVCSGCKVCLDKNLPNTRFILPWATDPQSYLRKALRVDAITNDTSQKIILQLGKTIPTAMLFLKKIRKIDVKINGYLHRKFERVDVENGLILEDSGKGNNKEKSHIWYVYNGDFSIKARNHRQ